MILLYLSKHDFEKGEFEFLPQKCQVGVLVCREHPWPHYVPHTESRRAKLPRTHQMIITGTKAPVTTTIYFEKCPQIV